MILPGLVYLAVLLIILRFTQGAALLNEGGRHDGKALDSGRGAQRAAHHRGQHLLVMR
jgi:hypothetical protein